MKKSVSMNTDCNLQPKMAAHADEAARHASRSTRCFSFFFIFLFTSFLHGSRTCAVWQDSSSWITTAALLTLVAGTLSCRRSVNSFTIPIVIMQVAETQGAKEGGELRAKLNANLYKLAILSLFLTNS